MQRNWLRVFLLCVACTLCLYGNCAAEDDEDSNEKWVECFSISDSTTFWVDSNSIKACEYNGRKYLEAKVRFKETYYENIPFVGGFWNKKTIYKGLFLYDIERNVCISLEWEIRGDKTKGKRDISEILNVKDPWLESDRQFIAWVEQHYPSVIQEIRQHNQQYAAQHPQANAPTGTVQGGAGTQTVTADGDYGFVQMLGDGPVQYSARMVHKPPTPYVKNDGITRSYVSGVPASGLHCEHGEFIPPVDPNSGKPLYIIYRGKDSQWNFSYHLVEHWVYAVFSYDNVTDTFTLYNGNNVAYKKIHIVDENTVEVDRIGDSGSFEDGVHFTYEYKKAEKDYDGWWNAWQDEDGYEWQATYSSGGWVSISEFDLIERAPVQISDDKECHNEVGLDGLFVFLVRKGNVGYAPLNAPLNTAKLQYIFAAE